MDGQSLLHFRDSLFKVASHLAEGVSFVCTSVDHLQLLSCLCVQLRPQCFSISPFTTVYPSTAVLSEPSATLHITVESRA